jgi:carbonic anhydrase
METYLQKRFGKDIFFLTYSAAVIDGNDDGYLAEIEQVIIRENIKKIYLVNDTSCRFINGIIERNEMAGLTSEKVLEDLYIENYFSVFKDKSIVYQQNKLAELNIKNQAIELMNSMLGNCIHESGIELKGLITTKHKGLIKELQIDPSEAAVYEF